MEQRGTATHQQNELHAEPKEDEEHDGLVMLLLTRHDVVDLSRLPGESIRDVCSHDAVTANTRGQRRRPADSTANTPQQLRGASASAQAPGLPARRRLRTAASGRNGPFGARSSRRPAAPAVATRRSARAA